MESKKKNDAEGQNHWAQAITMHTISCIIV